MLKKNIAFETKRTLSTNLFKNTIQKYVTLIQYANVIDDFHFIKKKKIKI